jgi:hypothetical protein
MNPLILLAIGGIALLAFKDKKKKDGAEKDVTGTIPQKTGREPPPTQEEKTLEEQSVNSLMMGVVSGQIPVVFGPMGQKAIDEGVIGLDENTFAYPVPGEYLTGWLTRVAYWNAYPYYRPGWPYQVPVSCMMDTLCPAEYLPARNALVRINEEIQRRFAELGFSDGKWNPESGIFE